MSDLDQTTAPADVPLTQDGLGCASGSEMQKAARLAGNSEMLDKFAED